ncbi:MAG TPA: YibE/F family protein [Candidatus Peribacteraceae bacterium]|nr:YibE/F family protein [Candidatus Peribacteraceae bacterium]
MRRIFLLITVCFSVAASMPQVFAQESATTADAASAQISQIYETAKVIDIGAETQDTPYGYQRITQPATMLITGGPDAGQRINIQNYIMQNQSSIRLSKGESVVLIKTIQQDGSATYSVSDQYRIPTLVWLTLIFIGCTILFGGFAGLTSLIGLGMSVLVLFLYVIPRIIAGDSPLLTCLIAAVLIACTSLYLAHGFNRRISVALLSTIVTLAIAFIVDIIFVYMAQLTGISSEEALFLQVGSLAHLDMRGLLLGGIILGCLGVLDDVTTAQCAAVEEVSRANPHLTPRELRKAGHSVGKEHIASLINTLVLAYVGASLPLLLLFKTQADAPVWITWNSQYIAEEIVRTLVGSLTLVLAVPISTFFAIRLLRANPQQLKKSASTNNIIMHKH